MTEPWGGCRARRLSPSVPSKSAQMIDRPGCMLFALIFLGSVMTALTTWIVLSIEGAQQGLPWWQIWPSNPYAMVVFLMLMLAGAVVGIVTAAAVLLIRWTIRSVPAVLGAGVTALCGTLVAAVLGGAGASLLFELPFGLCFAGVAAIAFPGICGVLYIVLGRAPRNAN